MPRKRSRVGAYELELVCKSQHLHVIGRLWVVDHAVYCFSTRCFLVGVAMICLQEVVKFKVHQLGFRVEVWVKLEYGGKSHVPKLSC